MDYRAISAQGPALSQVNADALVVVLTPDLAHTGDAALDRLIDDAVKAQDFALKAGKTLYVHRPAGVKASRLVLSAAANAEPKAFKAAVAKGLAAVKDLGAAHTAVAAAQGLALTTAHAQALALAVADATYVFRHTKPSAPKAGALKKVSLLCAVSEQAAVKQGLAQGEALAHGVTLARELGNLPGNYCTPSHLAHEARQLAKTHKHIKVEVLERPALEKLKMGSFLSVTNGSAQPPKFIVLRYQGAAASHAPLVLVGKGITFDTGGISLKPGAGMDEMKYDMGGAASVLGTFPTIAELQPKVNLVGLIPTCENMPSGTATKPGDVVTSMSGQTIEVLNTDAEGRLILCDALTYAQRFQPAALIDVATLTGACMVALGKYATGVMTKGSHDLAREILDAGETVFDRGWQLPLWDEYQPMLDSAFADIYNIGGRWAGAITAGCFLSRFTDGQRWVHLDIAGSASDDGKLGMATGRPVGMLSQWLLDRAG